MELKDILVVLDEIPDPPLGYKPTRHPADYYFNFEEDDAFSCPLQPTFIRRAQADLAKASNVISRVSLDDIFGRDIEREYIIRRELTWVGCCNVKVDSGADRFHVWIKFLCHVPARTVNASQKDIVVLSNTANTSPASV